jgi:hypothetical protein
MGVVPEILSHGDVRPISIYGTKRLTCRACSIHRPPLERIHSVHVHERGFSGKKDSSCANKNIYDADQKPVNRELLGRFPTA